MAGLQDMVSYHDDFLGAGILSATPSHDPWLLVDTSAAGTPVATRGGVNGVATLGFDDTSEIQNVCLAHGDNLGFDIDLVDHIEIGLNLGQATVDSATTLSFGLGSARADDPDNLAACALFRCVGSTAIVVETDDTLLTNDDIATGKSLGETLTKFVITFAAGKSNVHFFIGGDRVCAATTIDMSNYSGAFQPYFQIQKTADTNEDSVKIDYVKIASRRF
tara:strand:- start:336 stop:995 length:660 start_codon:yes stop_codon:yes gene_type:complete